MGFTDTLDRYRRRARIVLAGRRLRGRTPQPPPAPFVCGVTRSGTTLIRLMLDSHPELAIPGETHWVPKMIKAQERRKHSADELADQLLTPPLHVSDYAGGFGTLYTADYRPEERTVTYRWPDRAWPRTFDSPSDTVDVVLRDA